MKLYLLPFVGIGNMTFPLILAYIISPGIHCILTFTLVNSINLIVQAGGNLVSSAIQISDNVDNVSNDKAAIILALFHN